MTTQVVVRGTLKPDGTLELDEKPALPAGRVQVIVQPISQPPPNDPFWKQMEQIWAAQKTRGQVPRTREEIDAEINALREEAEEEMQAVERLHEECRQGRGKAKDAGENSA